ncbi:ATP-binding protein [Actinoallomurus purpureus]|uniref:ATP-binding protein n=1 Tax=Actinoallomurus purpureus TaxID=478114 RepID=UPI0025B24CF4|nr:sensor histidine kinase [Actinoallomurus purpureus]
MWPAPGRKLSTRILTSQLTILAASMLVGFGLFAHEERAKLDEQYRRRALAIAQTTAGTPEIQAAMEYGGAGDLVQSTAERMRKASGAGYIVVLDLQSVRHSHPNPALVGKPVAEPLIAADGGGHTGIDHGSLCRSANGKAPLYGPSGALVGEVSAGICERAVSSTLWSELPAFGLWLGIALALGAGASYVLAWRLKRRTFGLELEEIATLLQEREAMLHGIKEGVIGFDRAERITIVNDEARRLLGLGASAVGRRLEEVVPPGRLRDVLAGADDGADASVLTDEHYLTVNRRPVRLRGRELGAVVTLRDRTELSGLLRELDGVRALTDALRAQQHEFSNRMHTVAGLLELGDHDEAIAYLTTAQGAEAALSESVRERIANPLVVGLILAKSVVAAERGVTLTLTEDSWLGESPSHVQAVLTILGNLVDNAIDAAGRPRPGASAARPAEVTVRLTDGDGITMAVSDTGPGIPPGYADLIFTDGYSTKHTDHGGTDDARRAFEVRRRGLGLAIVHRLVRRIGGRIRVGEGPGATFTVRLPDSTWPHPAGERRAPGPPPHEKETI